MRRAILCVLLLGGTIGIPSAASASWVSSNCYNNNHADSNYRRVDARAYVSRAFKEGYEWGGGCWNDNNVDDTPKAPDSGGEGPDCSGLVFKAWELELAYGASGFRWWDKLQDVHGPYTSYSYHDAGTTTTLPFYRYDKTVNALYMDAFARDSHVGLLWSSVKNSDGTYWFAEAKGDDWGTNTWTETWMTDSAYVGVRRKAWTADCYPNCLASASPLVVVAKR